MLLPGILLTALATTFSPEDSRIVGASLFKNGLAVVVRETTLKGHEVILEALPQASLGTFWLSSSNNVQITEATTMMKVTPKMRDAGSIDELLAANVGKDIALTLTDGTVTGKLVSATGAIVILQQGTKSFVHQKATIKSLAVEDKLNFKLPYEDRQRVLRIKTTGAMNGKVYTVGLERGLTWVPAYSIDITDPKKLVITSKATVINDLGDLKDVEARLITGFPNVPFASILDPFTAGTSAAQFADAMVSSGGFGGGGFAPGAAQMSQNAYKMEKDFGDSMEIKSLPGMTAEDLFFYRRPDVSLQQGERGYYILFKKETEYEHIYAWDIANTIQSDTDYGRGPVDPYDVWHSLKFPNKSELPWTTATATTFKQGEILGQDMMSYVSIGSDALVKITKALDVNADQTEEEINRERGAYRLPNSGTVYDLVTLKGSLQVINRKSEDIKMRITRNFTGDLVSADGSPKVTKTAKGLRQINSNGRLAWEQSVGAGKTLNLTFTYKVFINGG